MKRKKMSHSKYSKSNSVKKLKEISKISSIRYNKKFMMQTKSISLNILTTRTPSAKAYHHLCTLTKGSASLLKSLWVKKTRRFWWVRLAWSKSGCRIHIITRFSLFLWLNQSLWHILGRIALLWTMLRHQLFQIWLNLNQKMVLVFLN